MKRDKYKLFHEAQKKQKFLKDTRKVIWDKLEGFKNNPIKKKDLEERI